MTNEATAIPLVGSHVGKNNPPLDKTEISAFLQQNPEFLFGFLAEHGQAQLPSILEALLESDPALLTEITLPLPANGTASLPHAQMRIMRQRIARLTQQIQQLGATAEENARFDQLLHDFATGLLRATARTPEYLSTLIREYFTVDAVQLLRYTDISPQGKQTLHGWLESRTPLCGRLNEAHRQIVFDAHFPDTGSAALIAVGNNPLHPDWILALGRHTPDGFNPTQGTLFLNQIGELATAFLCTPINN